MTRPVPATTIAGMPIYFSIVGAICLLMAAWLMARRLRTWWFGAMAVGTVVGHEERESDASIFRLPVVTYTDAAGQLHRFTSVAGGIGKPFGIGAEVTVRYLTSNPGAAYVSGFWCMWAAPVAFLVLGIAGISPLWRV